MVTLHRVTDVQVWSAIGYADWLGPLAFYVTNTTSLVPTNQNFQVNYPCFRYLYGGLNNGSASIQGVCSGADVGRYLSMVLTGTNNAQGGLNVLRFCALLAYGTPIILSPPPRPPPPPVVVPVPAPKDTGLSDGEIAAIAVCGGVALLGMFAFALYRRKVAAAARTKTKEEEEARGKGWGSSLLSPWQTMLQPAMRHHWEFDVGGAAAAAAAAAAERGVAGGAQPGRTPGRGAPAPVPEDRTPAEKARMVRFEALKAELARMEAEHQRGG